MISAFYNETVFHYYDLISVANRAQSVRHHNDRLTTRFNQVIKGFLHLVFTFRVKCACSLIEEQDFRFAD